MNIAIIILFTLSSLFFIYHKRIRKRQKININTADRVLSKLYSFTGNNRNSQILSYLRKIDPFVFEELLLTSFEKKGYKIERNKRYTHDGGIDGKIWIGGKLCLIQAKRYKSYINKKHIAEFYDLVNNNKNVKQGYFIHTGKTGKRTYALYKESPIKIISGERLINQILNTK